jgi:hypothetical protein
MSIGPAERIALPTTFGPFSRKWLQGSFLLSEGGVVSMDH